MSQILAWVLAFAIAATPIASQAATPPDSKNAKLDDIPSQPSAPGLKPRQIPADIFQCVRSYTYKGEKIECDSNVRRDGERLRPILDSVPEAVSELNTYQHNRRAIKTAAYVGTTGILVAAAGYLVSHFFLSPGGSTTDLGIVVRNLAAASGIGILGGSVAYSIVLTRANEQHLGRAVDLYNNAHPGQSIELQFSTGWIP